jgi:hypothetical protein
MEIEGLNKICSLSFCLVISVAHFCMLTEVAGDHWDQDSWN